MNTTQHCNDQFQQLSQWTDSTTLTNINSSKHNQIIIGGRQEPQHFTRWIKEAVHIHKEGQHAMNRDEGSYQFSHDYNCFLDMVSSYHVKNQKNWVPASSDKGFWQNRNRNVNFQGNNLVVFWQIYITIHHVTSSTHLLTKISKHCRWTAFNKWKTHICWSLLDVFQQYLWAHRLLSNSVSQQVLSQTCPEILPMCF